jgi:AcrR family transcriptional regulator
MQTKKSLPKGGKQPGQSKPHSKEKILLAAFEEFAENGYLLASTNSIMKKADVSKGLIFHYFKNKKNLYLECAESVVNNIFDRVKISLYSEDDFFNVFYMAAINKINFLYENPLAAKFLADLFSQRVMDTLPEVSKFYSKGLGNIFNLLYPKFDESVLKDNIDKEQAFTFTFKIINSYADSHFRDSNGNYILTNERADSFLKDMKLIESFIKYGVYK